MKNTLETRLGIFFALALVVAVIILEMVGAAEYFKPGYQVTASFKNAQDLKRGDPVKVAGVEVGRVEGVALADDKAVVTMKINGKYNIRTDAKATIRFTGLMGQNFVSIQAGTPGAPMIAHSTGGALETFEQPDLSAVMAKLEGVASGVEGLTKSFSAENLSTLLGPVTDFMSQNRTNLNDILSNVRLVTEDVAQGRGTVGKLVRDPAFYNASFSAVTNLQAASGDLKVLLVQAGSMMNQARGLLDEVNSGQGTIGKFLKDETLFVQSTNVMGNLNEIMLKMNRGTGTVARVINDESLYKNAKLGLQKLEKATEGLEDQGPLSILGTLVGSLF